MNTPDDETKRQWIARVTSGERSPIDSLTDAERAVLLKLREAGYDLVRTAYHPRYIQRRAA